jgi:hypothetical protein
MGSDEPSENYLFDDEALERTLAEGTDEEHEIIDDCEGGQLCLTSASKESFLSVFPDEKDKIAGFSIIRKKVSDNQIAAAFTDQLQNYPDIDSDEVQDKIALLATAHRCGMTVVTGEVISTTTRIKILAEQVGVRCINTDEFFEEIG